ncbi:MAG: DUF1287 domain-containing protein [Deltaproteobacteria bacterium]|nr:DUF1287 domain-containing protein [Deltaproteobacteria bacterium]
MRDDDLLAPARPRRRRRLSPAFLAGLVLVGLGGLVALWIWVFTPVFMTPQEFHEHQKRFDRAIRDVLRAHGPGGSDPGLPPWPPPLDDDRLRVLACAESEVVRGVRFLASQQPIGYPWGDLPPQFGTSADLIVRCLRAVNVDLQQMIHVDRKAQPKRYPLELLSNKKPDRGLDHRRVSFLFAFLHHFLPAGPLEIETPADLARWLPGDLVFWAEGGRQGHPGLAGIISDRRDETGMPLVITLLPDDARASSHRRLDAWPLIGHATLDVDGLNERFLEAYPGTPLEGRPPPPPAP